MFIRVLRYEKIHLILLFRRRGQQSNKFELRIRTTHPEGMIAWMGRGKIEHLMLSLHEGHVVLTYKSKNEQISLKSRVSFKLLAASLWNLWNVTKRNFIILTL